MSEISALRRAAAGLRAPARAVEAVLVVAAATFGVFATHDVRYILTHPYWLDEAWVAVSARLPVSDLLHVSSSTPPGWNLLQRPFTAIGEQGGRTLPLLFIVALAVCAYYAASILAAREGWGSYVVGATAGFGVVILPMTLIRNDLKQYTADGFMALLLIALAAAAKHHGWRTWRLWLLAAVAVAGFAVSITTLFMFLAVGAVWLIDLLAGRQWQSLLRGVAPMAVGLVGSGLLYLLLYARANNSVLNAYWNDYYPTARALPGFTLAQLRFNGPHLILGHWWPTVIGCVLAVVMLLWRCRSTFSLLPVILPVEMAAVAVLKKYPLLDTRTSYFLFVVMTFFAFVGAAGAVVVLCRLVLRRHAAVAAALAACLVVVGSAPIAVQAWPQARAQSIPKEDARDQIAYVAKHFKAGDVILLNRYAGYAFGYYWDKDVPGWRPDTAFATAFQIDYADDDAIVIADDDSPHWVTDTAAKAHAQGGTLWVIRTHMTAAAATSWAQAGPLQTIATGPEQLGVIPAR